MTNDIESVIPGPAKQDLVDINSLLALTVEQALKLVAASRQIDWGLGGAGNAKSIKDFSVSIKEAADNQQKFLNQASNYSFLIQQVRELEKAEANTVKTQARSSIVRSEANKEVIEYRENIRKSNLEIKNEIIVQNAAIGSLAQLRAQLNLTKQKYAELGAEVRDSAVGKELLMQVQSFDAVVKKLEADMGVFGRNVGNYNMVQHNMSQVVRELPALGIDFRTFVLAISNNIPMLQDSMKQMKEQGKSTKQIWGALASSLFSFNTLLIGGITVLLLYGDKLFAATEKIKVYKDEVKALQAVNVEVSGQFVKEAKELEILRDRFLSATTSVHEKQQIVDKLNTTYGENIGRLNSISEAEKFFIDRSGDFIEAVTLRAQISGAYDKIAENQKKVFEQMEKESTNFVQGTANVFQAFFDADPLSSGGSWEKYYENFAALQKAAANRNLSIVKSDVDKANGTMEDFINSAYTRLAELEQQGGFDFEKDKQGDSAADKAAKLAAKRREEWRKGEKKNWEQQFKTQKNALESEMEANKALAEDERASYETRIDALEIYYDRKRELIDATADYEKWKGTKDAEDIKTDRLTKLADLHGEALKMEAKAAEDSLKQERERSQLIIENRIALSNFNKKNAEDQLKVDRWYKEESIRIEKERIDRITDFRKKSVETTVAFSNFVADTELEGLSEKTANIEREKNAELAKIEALTIADEEKQALRISAENRAADQLREIQKKEEEVKRKQFTINKAGELASIAINTQAQVAAITAAGAAAYAQSVAAYAGVPGGAGLGMTQGAALQAQILTQIPYVYGSAALSAGLIAAQVMAYAEGTDFHPYTGPAWVGDGGEHELIKEPSGKTYWSPATDTLMNLPRGTSVTPMSQLIEESNGMLTPRLLNTMMLQSGGNTARMERMMREKLDEVTDAIRSKPVQRVTFSNGFMQEAVITGRNYQTRLKKRI